MDIEDWRQKIDEIDEELLKLLRKRSEYCTEIGKIKTQKGLPIHSPEREKNIMEKLIKANAGPLSNEGVHRIFERIIDESRKLEKDLSEEQHSNKKEG